MAICKLCIAEAGENPFYHDVVAPLDLSAQRKTITSGLIYTSRKRAKTRYNLLCTKKAYNLALFLLRRDELERGIRAGP